MALRNFRAPPHISWSQSRLPKNKGGLGLIDFAAWNMATIAKLVWAIAEKKDALWVCWVHGRYIRRRDWWEYNPPPDSCWY